MVLKQNVQIKMIRLFFALLLPYLSRGYDLVCTDVKGRPLSSPPFPIPENCNGYYQCFGGYLAVVPCFGNRVFDLAERSCVDSTNDGDCAPRTATVCERRSSTVSCPSGSVITVKYGFYGRQDRSNKCGSSTTTNCISSNSLETLKDLCNNKRTCRLEANNGVFGDPCPGVNKYIRMNYYCNKIEEPVAWHKRVLCENQERELKCPQGQVLTIRNGFYGRYNPYICPNKLMKTTTCAASQSLGEMQRACNGRRSCSITPSSSRFGDPCPGTWKYAEIIFSCVPSPTTTVTVCERRQREISCSRNQVINVERGFYGRAEKQTCYSTNVRGNRCISNAREKLRRSCNNRRSCRLNASNSLYGDPCRGQLKYLQVTYRCVNRG